MQLSLSIEEVKKATGFGRTKIYEAINEGRLPAKKYGKRTIILKSDLENSNGYLPKRVRTIWAEYDAAF